MLIRQLLDWLFGTALFAVTAYAGHVLFGDIEGVAIWRILFLAGTGGFLFGYRVCMTTRYARHYDGDHVMTLDRRTGTVTTGPTRAYRRKMRRQGGGLLGNYQGRSG